MSGFTGPKMKRQAEEAETRDVPKIKRSPFKKRKPVARRKPKLVF